MDRSTPAVNTPPAPEKRLAAFAVAVKGFSIILTLEAALQQLSISSILVAPPVPRGEIEMCLAM